MFEQLGPILSIVASADLSAFHRCAVALNSSGQAIAPAAGGQIFGVLTDKPTAAGQAAPCQVDGIAEVKFGGVVAIGDLLKVDTSGRFLLAATGDRAVARAMTVGALNTFGAAKIFGGAFVLSP